MHNTLIITVIIIVKLLILWWYVRMGLVCRSATPRHVLWYSRVHLQSQDVAGTVPRVAEVAGATC